MLFEPMVVWFSIVSLGVANQLSNPSDRASVKKTVIPISYSTENSEEPIF